MKIFLVLLILIFGIQSLVKADDIRDFEIEQISLYDSALNFFTKKELKDGKRNFYQTNKYTTSAIKKKTFEVYEVLQVSYKTDDAKFEILDISGISFMNYKKCLKEIEKIALDFDQMFPNTVKDDLYTYINNDDPSGKSKVSDIYWFFENRDVIVLACYYIDSEYGKKNNLKSEIRVSLSSDEFNKFLISESQ